MQQNLIYGFLHTQIVAEISPRSAAPLIQCVHLAGLQPSKQYIMQIITTISFFFRFVKIIFVLPNLGMSVSYHFLSGVQWFSELPLD